jgi:ATP-dependent Clp protease ATP-binding subunit ClpX
MPTDHEVCSFCGSEKNEVPNNRLIKGNGVYICETCVEGASNLIEQSAPKGDKKREPVLGTPHQIKAYLDEHIIAQERLKRAVSTAVYHHFKRRDAARAKKAGSIKVQKSNMLILGPTGSGKTETFRAISELLKVPFYTQDCTRLTQQGYVGDDADDMLRGLVQNAGGDIQRAEWGIILLDEFDKIARKSGRSASGYRDITGEGVQQGMLRTLEGCSVPVTRGMGKNVSVTSVGPNGEVRSNVDVLDTTNILFVAAGSFAGIDEVVEQRVNKSSRLGFGSEDTKRRKLTLNEVYTEVKGEDILEFGIIPEMLGRLPIVTSTLELSDEDMVKVLTEPKNALVKQYQALFAMDDIDLQFDTDALLAIGQEAKRRPTGARGLRSILEETLAPYAYDGPSMDIASIRITADVITGKGVPIIVDGRRTLKARA